MSTNEQSDPPPVPLATGLEVYVLPASNPRHSAFHARIESISPCGRYVRVIPNLGKQDAWLVSAAECKPTGRRFSMNQVNGTWYIWDTNSTCGAL